MFKFSKFFVLVLFGLFICLSSVQAAEPVALNSLSKEVYAKGTVNGKYDELIYILKAPEDKAGYGTFKDYGFWGGGPWGGVSNNPGGFWVYVEPYWLIFKTKK